MQLNGMEVYTSKAMVDKLFFRHCRSKKKRIRKKWLKDARNYRLVPKKEVYTAGNRLIMHPETFEALRRANQ